MKLGEFALQHLEATVFVRNRGRLDNLALIWLEHTEVTALTADINAYHIGKAGGIDRRRWNIGWTHTNRFLSDHQRAAFSRTGRWQRNCRPARASVNSCWIASLPALAGSCHKPNRRLELWWAGNRLPKLVTGSEPRSGQKVIRRFSRCSRQSSRFSASRKSSAIN
jgi:hypothetical protein